MSNRKPQRYFYFYLCFQGIRSLVRKIKWGLRKSHVTPLLAVLLSRVLGMELFFKPPFAATHFHNITHPYSIIHAVISVCTCCNLQLRMLAEAYVWCRKKNVQFSPSVQLLFNDLTLLYNLMFEPQQFDVSSFFASLSSLFFWQNVNAKCIEKLEKGG